MKKNKPLAGFFFLFLFAFPLLSGTAVFAQNRKLDSLKQLVANSKNDTANARNLWKIAAFYFVRKNDEDSTLYYASRGYALAEKHVFLMGMWVNLAEQCFVYQRHGNYQKTLGLYLDFLKLCEEKKDLQVTSRVLNFISELYIKLEDYQQAIIYAKKNTSRIIESKIGEAWLMGNFYNIGVSYTHLHQPDSALTYFQQGFALANHNKSNLGGQDQLLVGLGMANQQLDNNDIALAYFDEAIRNEKAYQNEDLYFAYLQKAELLQKLNRIDSSIVYYEKSLQTIKGNFNDHARIYKALANIYLAKDPARSVKYFAAEQKIRDSLFAEDKIKAIQTLTYNEQERQNELANAQREAAATHKKNIENTLIAIGIIGFLILFLLLSRSIMANEKWIRFLGIVGLLILFEFINLLLHPLLEKLTHHSSLLMLLIMVGIAALLVPLHHKIEKWVTTRMVEKNKELRIAAAKKTIEKLEGKTGIS